MSDILRVWHGEATERGATIGAMQNPASIRWTDHAAVKAVHLGITRSDVESAVLDHHHRRQRNHRGGDWKLVASGLVVVYNHPDEDDPSIALVVTLWRQR